MLAGYYQKPKERFQKKALVKGIKIFLRTKKTKSIYMLVNDIEFFLTKRKTKSEKMAVNEISIFIKMKNKG